MVRMVGVFLFLLHLPSFRDHGLEVVGIAVIPRHDGVVTFAADEAKPLRQSTSSVKIPSTHSNADVDADPTAGWRAVQRERGLVELCRMLSRLRRGCDVGINVVLSAGRYIEDLGAQQLAPV